MQNWELWKTDAIICIVNPSEITSNHRKDSLLDSIRLLISSKGDGSLSLSSYLPSGLRNFSTKKREREREFSYVEDLLISSILASLVIVDKVLSVFETVFFLRCIQTTQHSPTLDYLFIISFNAILWYDFFFVFRFDLEQKSSKLIWAYFLSISLLQSIAEPLRDTIGLIFFSSSSRHRWFNILSPLLGFLFFVKTTKKLRRYEGMERKLFLNVLFAYFFFAFHSSVGGRIGKKKGLESFFSLLKSHKHRNLWSKCVLVCVCVCVSVSVSVWICREK